MQIPLFLLSLSLTLYSLSYKTPVSALELYHPSSTIRDDTDSVYQGTGNNARDILKRIDYGGSFTLMGSVSSYPRLGGMECAKVRSGRIHPCITELTIQRRPFGELSDKF